VDDDRIGACHIADRDTGTQDHPAPGLDGMHACMVKDNHIAPGRDRPLDTALAADNSTPAGNIHCHAGTRAQLERTGDSEPAPEMGMGGNDKVTVYLHVPFEIRTFLRKIGISFLDERGH